MCAAAATTAAAAHAGALCRYCSILLCRLSSPRLLDVMRRFFLKVARNLIVLMISLSAFAGKPTLDRLDWEPHIP